MATVVWPVERMAEVLDGRVTQRSCSQYTLRCENAELGIKLKLDLSQGADSFRLVVDRTGKQRPTFVASLLLDRAIGVELNQASCEVTIVLATGQHLTISAHCTWQLYRPA